MREYIQSAIVSSQPPDTDIKQRRDTGCFFTGSALKVLSMELVPTNRRKMTGLAMQASSQRFLGQASGASSA